MVMKIKLSTIVLLVIALTAKAQNPVEINGVYPHLAITGSHEDRSESGIGALLPWADKLWMVGYVAHISGSGTGFEAWRRLMSFYDPQDTETDLQGLQYVLQPPALKSYDDVTASVEKWLSEKAKITGETSEGLNETILRAILINMMSIELRKHLRENVETSSTRSTGST